VQSLLNTSHCVQFNGPLMCMPVD